MHIYMEADKDNPGLTYMIKIMRGEIYYLSEMHYTRRAKTKVRELKSLRWVNAKSRAMSVTTVQLEVIKLLYPDAHYMQIDTSGLK